MKARYIRKLRKRISNFKEYTVIPSYGLFGLFGDFHTMRSIKSTCVTFNADDPRHAIRKYLRWYYRKWKQRHKYAFIDLIECTEHWGKFKVTDVKKGFVYYYM